MQCNYVYYTVSTCHRLGSPSFCFFIALCLHTNIPKPLLYNVSVWAHGFVYWKASVFPMTAIEEWGGGRGNNRKKGEHKASTQMSCGLQRITIFIQFPLVQNFSNEIWPHFVIEYTKKFILSGFFSLVGCCCQFNWNLRVQLTSYFVNIESFSA